MDRNVTLARLLAGEKVKRIEGLIQERFFESRLSPIINKNVEFPLSLGWVKGYLKGERVWVKLLPDLDQISETDIKFSSFLMEKRPDDPVLYVVPEFKKGIYDIKFWIYGAPRCIFESGYSEIVNRNIFDSGAFLMQRDVAEVCGDKKWAIEFFDLFSEQDINWLACVRAFLNHCIDKPVDLDAVSIVRDKSFKCGYRGVFYEYKRKDPMEGFIPFSGTRKPTLEWLKHLQNTVASELVSKNEELSYTEVRRLLYEHMDNLELSDCFGKYCNGRAFGLDLSHVEHALLAGKGYYEYIIWNRKKPRKVDEIFTESLYPNQANGGDRRDFDIRILKKYIENVFVGISFTIHGDSGSFHSRFRIQLVIREDSFEDFELARSEVFKGGL